MVAAIDEVNSSLPWSRATMSLSTSLVSWTEPRTLRSIIFSSF